MAGFGGAVKLTGESEYRKALTQITANLRSVSAEMKATASSFSAGNSSMAETTQRADSLKTALSAQKDALSAMKSELATMVAQYQKNGAAHQALLGKYDAEKAKLAEIESTLGKSSQEYKDQKTVVDALAQEVQDSTKAYDAQTKAIQDMTTRTANAETTYNQTAQALEKLGKEAEDSGKKADSASNGGWTIMKQVLADLASQAINSAINGLKSLGRAAIDTGKQAIASYAQYEQLEGGVKKIFGDDMAQEVISNANKAFSTAGMSANEYMDTVTGFSATLLQGLGEDTSQAASYADTAIRNMSDNANTFGTDMASIQHAYQGFAKGNFTMLDNLKLGYGGTQAEMARLINESGVLGDAMEVTAETVKDVPFHTMIEAIDKTQERMGIMDTTMKEAAGTIEGSTGSMKAAWQNMLTGMVDENANFEQLATNFINTLITPDGTGGAIGTLVPRIAQVITGMSNALQTMLPALISAVVPIIQSNLPVILSAVEGAIQTIVAVLPTIIDAIAPLIPQIVSMLVGMLPQLINAGIQILLSLIKGIQDTIPQLIAMLPTIIKDIVNTLVQNLPLIIKAGVDLLVALIDGLAQAIPQLIDYIPEIVDTIVTVLIENLPMLVDAAIQIIVALTNGLIQSLPKLATMVPRIITTIVSTLARNVAQVIPMGVKVVTSVIEGIGNTLGQLLTKAKEIGKTVIDAMKEFPQKMKEAGVNLVKGIWEGISNSLDWIKSKITTWVGNVTQFIKKLFGISSPSKLMRDEVGKYLAEGIGVGFEDEMDTVAKQMGDAIPTSFDVSPTINGVSGSRYGAANGFYDMVSAFKTALGQMTIELDDEVAGRFVEKTVARAIYS